MTAAPDTFAACLTPAGRGAIATLGLRGPRAWTVVRGLFQPATRLPETPEAGRFWFGRMGVGKSCDDVVVAVRSIEPVLEIDVHCHGGVEAVRMLLELFAERGVRVCTWQEFDEHADRLCHLARTRLPHAPTVRTASILLDQAQGALTRAVRDAMAFLHAGRDSEASSILDELLRYTSVGRHLTEPWRLVVAGAPNVGKSSLINALAGYERSIVAPLPGTTRDVVTTTLAIDGWPIEAADTAGWRTTADALEAEGIARARTAAAEADLCLWVLDASTAPVLPPDGDFSVHMVINKIDLPAAWDTRQLRAALRLSAKTGEGMTELCHFISQALVPCPPPPGAAVPFGGALAQYLAAARRLLAGGRDEDALNTLTESCLLDLSQGDPK